MEYKADCTSVIFEISKCFAMLTQFTNLTGIFIFFACADHDVLKDCMLPIVLLANCNNKCQVHMNNNEIDIAEILLSSETKGTVTFLRMLGEGPISDRDPQPVTTPSPSKS